MVIFGVSPVGSLTKSNDLIFLSDYVHVYTLLLFVVGYTKD